MKPAQAWLAAIRPRTLGLAVSPVLVGTALAVAEGAVFRPLPMVLALIAAVLIQVGTNLHNDVADHLRGTDGPDRQGPPRATAQGWLTPRVVRRGAWIAFGSALLVGAGLAWLGGWPIVVLGLAALIAGAAYSGGPRPLSTLPLGELFVFLFFGLVAVAGSYELQTLHFSSRAWLAGALLGLPAAAVLLVNNLRDRHGDARSGRRTLAVLLPPVASRVLYGLCLLLPFLLIPVLFQGKVWFLLPQLLLLPALGLVRRFWRARSGLAFNRLLADTVGFQLWLGGVVALALLIARAA